MKIEVVSQAAAETADMVVCMPWRSPECFLDDVQGTCSECLRAIRHRPTAPKRPRKVCAPCAATMTLDDVVPVTTAEAMAELEAYRKRKFHG